MSPWYILYKGDREIEGYENVCGVWYGQIALQMGNVLSRVVFEKVHAKCISWAGVTREGSSFVGECRYVEIGGVEVFAVRIVIKLWFAVSHIDCILRAGEG